MVTWDIIDAVGDEETKLFIDNFSSTSLFEVIKLAYLEPTTQLTTQPKIASCVSYGLVSLSLDSSVFIFGEDHSSLILSLSFDHVIDVMVWLPGGKFLLLGDSSGTLHCVHIASRKIVFTKKLPVKTITSDSVFVESKSFTSTDGMINVVLMAKSGNVICLDNIDIEGLEEGLKIKDIPFLSSLQSKMSVSVYSYNCGAQEVFCGDCAVYGSRLCTWIGGESGIYSFLSVESDTDKCIWNALAEGFRCAQLVHIMKGRYIVALDFEKNLWVICGHSGIVLWCSDKESSTLTRNIESMQCLSSGDSDAQLLLLLNDYEGKGSSLCTFDIPSYECSFMVAITSKSALLKIGNEADSVIYLDPEFEMEGKTEVLKRLKLKNVMDGVPETRLANLLRKNKFAEAEEFCGTFNLDINEVLKAKAKFLCELMNPWQIASGNSTVMDPFSAASESFEELLLTLSRISDNEFVTTLCINALLIDIDLTGKLLYYAKERLAKASQSGDSDHLSSLMKLVSKNLYCLCSFQSIFSSSDIQDWLAFCRSNKLEEFKNHLQKGNLDVAATIWHRHQYEFGGDVDANCVNHILQSIPFNIPAEKLSSWLPNHLVKDLIKLCPSAIENIAAWITERIKDLEIIEEEHWPLNGLELATKIIEAIETVSADFFTGGEIDIQLAVHTAQWKAHSPSSHLYYLRETASALSEMQTLFQKFYVRIKFSDYTQDNKSAVVAALLDQLVDGEDVQPLVKDFIQSFVMRHGMKLDEVLASYVTDCLASCCVTWWAVEEAQWEDKIYAVISVISDSVLKAKCILECMRVAPVPWSEGTQKMCVLGVALNTRFTFDIQAQEKLSKLKLVLRKHNLHLIDYENQRNTQFILRSIVSRESEDIIEDALTVASAFSNIRPDYIYFHRVLYLLQTQDCKGARDLLSILKPEDSKSTCHYIMNHVVQQLSIDPQNEKCNEKLKNLTSGILAIQPILESNINTKFSKYEDVFGNIRKINVIQEKYDLYPTLEELENEDTCLSYVRDFVINLYVLMQNNQKPVSSNTKNRALTTTLGNATCIPTKIDHSDLQTTATRSLETNTKSEEEFLWKNIKRVEHLAFNFGVSRHRLYSMLAAMANQRSEFSVVLECAKRLTDGVNSISASDVIMTMARMASEFLGRPSTVSNLNIDEDITRQRKHFVDVLYKVVSKFILTSRPCEIELLIQLAMWYRFGTYMYEQCHSKGVFIGDDCESTDASLHREIFSYVFRDSSMPIEEPVVSKLLSTVLDIIQIIPTKDSANSGQGIDSGCIFALPEMTKALDEFIIHLQERSQDLVLFLISQNVSSDRMLKEVKMTGTKCQNNLISSGFIQTFILKILNSKQGDLAFATSLLTLFPLKESLKIVNQIIKRLGYDYPRLLLVGEIGCDFCKLNNLNDISNQFSVLICRASWGVKLEKLGISFKTAFSGDKFALRKIVHALMSHSDCTLNILYDFCNDFSWDKYELLENFLRLSIQNMDSYYLDKSTSNKDFVPELSSFYGKVESIIEKISHKLDVYKILDEELKKVSSYSYELLDVILLLLGTLDKEEIRNIKCEKDILKFIKAYQRHQRPGNYEIENWSEKYSTNLPTISEIRLPFHEMNCKDNKESKAIMKQIIQKECDDSNADKWIGAAHIFKTSSDQICFLAASNLIENLPNVDRSAGWQINSNREVGKIYSRINKIKDNSLSITCALSLMKKLPPGADKLENSRIACLLTEGALASDPHSVDIKKTLDRFNSWYKLLAVEHALNKYRLAQPKYISMRGDPIKLILALYEHSSISSLTTMNTEDIINIDNCITEICNAYSINKNQMLLNVLSKWLPATESTDEDEDQTVANFKLNLNQEILVDEPGEGLFDASLSRVIYLLRCCPIETATNYLVSLALTDNEGIGNVIRLKALRCLLAVADEETIPVVCNCTMDDIRTLLQTLTYVTRLEKLGYPISLASFGSMDKDALVEGIWRSHKHDSNALLLIIDICRDFKITRASLWGAVLNQLCRQCKMKEISMEVLEKVLMEIRNIPNLWLLSQLAASWELVIYFPFLKASSPVCEKTLVSCAHSVSLLMRSCPVDIPLDSLVSLCKSLDLPLLLLAVSSKTLTKENEVQFVLETYSKPLLKSQYKEIKKHLVLPQCIEDFISSLGSSTGK